jgi:hypothetical protein
LEFVGKESDRSFCRNIVCSLVTLTRWIFVGKYGEWVFWISRRE